MMHYNAIAAMSYNRVIGYQNTIPWHVPADFKWFKQKTMGHVLIMGRKTYQSIGRPLPGRTTVVLSRNTNQLGNPDVKIISDLKDIDLLQLAADQQIFICGGGQIYKETLPFCSHLYLTIIKKEVKGDVFMPEFETYFSSYNLIEDHPSHEIRHYKK